MPNSSPLPAFIRPMLAKPGRLAVKGWFRLGFGILLSGSRAASLGAAGFERARAISWDGVIERLVGTDA